MHEPGLAAAPGLNVDRISSRNDFCDAHGYDAQDSDGRDVKICIIIVGGRLFALRPFPTERFELEENPIGRGGFWALLISPSVVKC